MGLAEESGIFYRDPRYALRGIRNKLHGIWLRSTYPFAEFGRGVSVDSSCEIERSKSSEIRLGDGVYLAPDVWLDVAEGSTDSGPSPKIIIGSGCEIGRRCSISARNRITLEADVLLAPSVLIRDHDQQRSGIKQPSDESRMTGGQIFIGRNCWLGIGAVIACGSGEINLGRNSVVAANAVVTRSFPPFSVIAGNPAKLVKTYDQQTRKWVKPNGQRV
jgi:acetyltransferase-like isoleucine patch superfamily enzyme